MEYQLKYYNDLHGVHQERVLHGPEAQQAATACLICVDAEIQGIAPFTGGVIHRTDHDRGAGKACDILLNLFAITGIEAVWAQPYKVLIFRSELAGGGWKKIIPRAVWTLHEHLDPENPMPPKEIQILKPEPTPPDLPSRVDPSEPDGSVESILGTLQGPVLFADEEIDTEDPVGDFFRHSTPEARAALEGAVLRLDEYRTAVMAHRDTLAKLSSGDLRDIAVAIKSGSSGRALPPLSLGKQDLLALAAASNFTSEYLKVSQIIGDGLSHSGGSA
jgi:hypothetical protein